MAYELVKLETGDVIEVVIDVPGLALMAAHAALHNTSSCSRLDGGLVVAKVVNRVTDDWRTRRKKRRENESAAS
jgi:hypothetical protein